MHILVVDDHDFQRSLMLRQLRELGEADLEEARDGAEALAAARLTRPEVVISDLNMPGTDGMTFIHHLAQERLADSLIISSGLASGVLRAVEAMAVASGLRVLGAVSKPLRTDRLASLLHAHRHPAGRDSTPVVDAPVVDRAAAIGEFKAWFSPILDVSALHVVAVESAARWESAEHGTLFGDEALAAADQADATGAAARAVIDAALSGGALWQQLDWHGSLVIPLSATALRDEKLVDWIESRARSNGLLGSAVAVSINASAFTDDAPHASLALARALMHGYLVTIHVRTPADLDALTRVSSCNLVTCPAAWLHAEPGALQRLRDIAAKLRADLGVTGVDDAQVLGRLGEARVRFAQGSAVGQAASAAETYDLHLART